MDNLIDLCKEPFFIHTLLNVFLKEGNYTEFYKYSIVCKSWYLISRYVLLNYLRTQLPKCIKPCTSLTKIPIEFIEYPVNIDTISTINMHTHRYIYPTYNTIKEWSVYWIHGIMYEDKILLINLSYDGNKISIHRCKNNGYTIVEPNNIISCLTGCRLKLK